MKVSNLTPNTNDDGNVFWIDENKNAILVSIKKFHMVLILSERFLFKNQ